MVCTSRLNGAYLLRKWCVPPFFSAFLRYCLFFYGFFFFEFLNFQVLFGSVRSMMSASGSKPEHVQPATWREIEVITSQFMRCPAYKPASSASGVGRWSLSPFHYHVYNMILFRWLNCGQQKGKDRVAQLHAAVCPGMDCRHWSPKRKKQGTAVTDHGTASAEQALIHMVTTPWLLLYLMLPIFRNTNRGAEDSLRQEKCHDLLAWACNTCTKSYQISILETGEKLHVAGGKVHVTDHGTDLVKVIMQCDNGLGDKSSLSFWLLAVSQSLYNGTLTDGEIARHMAYLGSELFSYVCAGLDSWAASRPRASLHMLLRTQVRGLKRGRHGNVGIRAAMSKKRKMGSSGRDLAADSGMGQLGVDTADVQVKTCTVYYNSVHSAIEAANTLELCMDASRFSTRDTEITCVYAYDGKRTSSCNSHVTDHGTESPGCIAYLPPVQHRELKWRSGTADEKPTAEDREKFNKEGFRAQPGMATKDYVQMVNTLLKHAGKTLVAFQCPLLPRMEAGSHRVWCPFRRRWYRIPAAISANRLEEAINAATPELPDEILSADWSKLPMLLLTLDQASTGWGACHFLVSPMTAHGMVRPARQRQRLVIRRQPGGMNLLLDFVCDPYHRSWNDWKWAIKHGSGNLASSVLQMTVVYNHNYQPYLNGSNLVKKAEFLQEFHHFCSLSSGWDEIVSTLQLDGATAHGAHTEKEARDLFKAFILNCEHFKKKGTFVRNSAWYSIVEAASHHDATFQALRFLLTQIAKGLLKDTKQLEELQKKAEKLAEQTDHGCKTDYQSKEEHKAAIQAMKKRQAPGSKLYCVRF